MVINLTLILCPQSTVFYNDCLQVFNLTYFLFMMKNDFDILIKSPLFQFSSIPLGPNLGEVCVTVLNYFG